MSRNSKIRVAAEVLPPYPKINNRRVQRDSSGNILYVNHFRELKKIQENMAANGYGHKHPKTAEAWAKYCGMVISYDKRQKRKQVRNKTAIALLIIIAIAAFGAAQNYFKLIF